MLPLWEACLRGCGLQETLGAETRPLTHTELSPSAEAGLGAAHLWPTAVALAQASGLQAASYSLPILPVASAGIRQGGLRSLFSLSFFPGSFVGRIAGAKVEFLSRFLQGPVSGGSPVCTRGAGRRQCGVRLSAPEEDPVPGSVSGGEALLRSQQNTVFNKMALVSHRESEGQTGFLCEMLTAAPWALPGAAAFHSAQEGPGGR